MMKTVLTFERLALGAAATALFWATQDWTGVSLLAFLVLFFAPDLSFVAYLAGPKIGAFFYNALHTWLAPVLVAAFALLTDWRYGYGIALIWCAHIAFDRSVGYGLKYATGFKDTHLGPIGKKP